MGLPFWYALELDFDDVSMYAISVVVSYFEKQNKPERGNSPQFRLYFILIKV